MSYQNPPGGMYPPQYGYPPQEGYPPQGGYPPPGGYPQSGGYPPPGGYPGQGGYPAPGGFQAPGGFPAPGGFGFQPPPQGGFPGFHPPPMGHIPPPQDAEQGYMNSGGFGFSDKTVRMGFIRKVYGILMTQMAVTVAIISFFLFHEGTRQFVSKNPAVFLVAMVVMFVTLIVLSCCGDVRRKAPMNFICLGIFTLAEGFLLGCTTLRFGRDEVFYAALLTFIVTVGLTLFAFQTKIDFTAMGGILFVAALILMVFGIVCIFFPGNTLRLIYSCLGAFLFSVYIVYDTQMLVGGDHKCSLSPEEYVFGALTLYMDIVNLFTHILSIIGALNDD